jgi:hypothetical protein
MAKVEINRRSSNDPKWNQLRERLRRRDTSCRLSQCLTIAEASQIKIGREHCDCAHMFSASSFPELIYNDRNVYRICRSMHRRLDEFKDPVTGDFIDENHHWWWWYRIVHKSTEKYNNEIDYEMKLREYVGINQ